MIDMLGGSSPVLRGTIVLGLGIALKATLLMLVALAAHVLLGRRRLLVRSVVWNACLLGLLLLPIAAAGFPRLFLSDPRGSIGAPGAVRPVSRPAGARESAPVDEKSASLPAVTHPNPAPAPVRRLDWPLVLSAVYVVVAGGMIARLGLSLLAVGRLKRSSPAVALPRWVEALARWQERLALHRTVRLARSPRLGVPVVVGGLRPVIVLPEDLVERAAIPTVDAVLLHELSHVRRGDYAWNIVLRLVQALYWPHPLVWPIGRIIAGVREQACDDLCIAWLGGPAPYGAALLEVTAGLLRRPWQALGLAMSRSTKLGRRLARIERSAGASRCLLGVPARSAIIAAVLAAFGLLGSVSLVRPRAAEPRPQQQAKPQQPPQPQPPQPGPVPAEGRLVISATTVKREKMRRIDSQPGTLHAFESVELFAKVSGYLKKQNVDIGDRVKQGALLAVIDAPELDKDEEQAMLAIRQARVAVKQAEGRLITAHNEVASIAAAVKQAEAEAAGSTANRKCSELETNYTKKLREQKIVSGEELARQEEKLAAATAAEQAAVAAVARARADVASAESRVDQARTDLGQAENGVSMAETRMLRARIMVGYTRITAPFDGIVTFRGFHPGAFVVAPDAGRSSPLLTVARTDRMRVVIHVPDSDVPWLDRGDPAEIRLDALPGQTFRGKVARFAETEDAQSRTMRTEIDLDNSGNKLREGMYGSVQIVLDDPPPGLTIPESALVSIAADGSSSCFRIENGRAVLTPIKFGLDDGERVQVVEGLKEGDTVAVNPRGDHLKGGEPVAVKEQ